jgi:hypothetical protein
MTQLDELLKVVLELEKRIEKLEGMGEDFHKRKTEIVKNAVVTVNSLDLCCDCLRKIEGLM